MNVLPSKVFNDYFEEFIGFIVSIFPEDVDILSIQTTIPVIRKNNPKLLMKKWNEYVAQKYASEISDGNIGFFLCKDYREDIEKFDNADKILEVIDRIRNPIRNMNDENLKTIIIYLKNMNKICMSLNDKNKVLW